MIQLEIYVVLPAWQARSTLAATVGEIPTGWPHHCLLVDDASQDRTAEVADLLGLETIRRPTNGGYGANQKTCYREALRRGADLVVMLHPDHQYDARVLPSLVAPIIEGRADVMLGSRLLSGASALGGMPWWRLVGNRLLTLTQNRLLNLSLSEYHTGLRAYSRKVLESIPFDSFDDGYLFDQQFLVEVARQGMTIGEVPARARYFRDVSSISFASSLRYGIDTLSVSWKGRLTR